MGIEGTMKQGRRTLSPILLRLLSIARFLWARLPLVSPVTAAVIITVIRRNALLVCLLSGGTFCLPSRRRRRRPTPRATVEGAAGAPAATLSSPAAALIATPPPLLCGGTVQEVLSHCAMHVGSGSRKKREEPRPPPPAATAEAEPWKTTRGQQLQQLNPRKHPTTTGTSISSSKKTHTSIRGASTSQTGQASSTISRDDTMIRQIKIPRKRKKKESHIINYVQFIHLIYMDQNLKKLSHTQENIPSMMVVVISLIAQCHGGKSS